MADSKARRVVADEDVTIAQTLALILRRKGLVVEVFSCPASALAHVRRLYR